MSSRSSQSNWEQERLKIQEESETHNFKDGLSVKSLGWSIVDHQLRELQQREEAVSPAAEDGGWRNEEQHSVTSVSWWLLFKPRTRLKQYASALQLMVLISQWRH